MITEPESFYVTASARNCTPLPRTRGGFGLSVCRRNSPPRLCHGHAPAALWSHPGSGNTWLRLVIELASGGRTGSIYSRKRRRCTGQAVHEDDAQTLLGRQARRCQWGHRLAAKMPSEFWPHRTRQDCASMVAMKVHSRRGWSHLSTSQPWVRIACGGAISRAVFLVRHPFVVAWSVLSSMYTLNATWRYGWTTAAVQVAQDWRSMITDSSNVDFSWRLWMRSRRPFLLVRLEDLKDPARSNLEVRRVIDFIYEGQPSAMRISCAWRRAESMLEKHRNGALVIDREMMHQKLEAPNAHFAGRWGGTPKGSAAAGIWAQVGTTAADMFGYERHGYHLLPM